MLAFISKTSLDETKDILASNPEYYDFYSIENILFIIINKKSSY